MTEDTGGLRRGRWGLLINFEEINPALPLGGGDVNDFSPALQARCAVSGGMPAARGFPLWGPLR